jgi:DNA replication protein DnaC
MPRYARIERSSETRRIVRPAVDRSIERISPGLRRAVRELVHGCHRWPAYIFGPVGVGKTAAVLTLVDQVPQSIYMTAAEMMDTVRDARAERLSSENGYAISERSLRDQWRNRQLLVIDEIGQRRDPTGWLDETVQRIIDDRESRPTILLGNHDLASLAKIMDDRVVSRLSAGTLIHVEGDDRRPGMGTLIHVGGPAKAKRGRRPTGES